ncbi:MAG: arylsulfatase, partial [Planctomycetota bacterium]
DLAGVGYPEGVDGFSMLPTLLGKPDKQRKHRFLYWEFHEQGKKQAVRMGEWKGVRLNVAKAPNGPIELYNLRTDPGETTDVASENPKVVERIAGIMRTARTPSERWTWPEQNA